MRDSPVPASEMEAVGDLAESCSQAVAALGPYPTEVEHARAWLSLAGPAEIELLGRDGAWAADAAARIEERLVSTARWCSDAWQQPWTGVAADQMAAAVAVATQGDTTPDEWLWSPFGEPTLGNSARLDGSQRHLAHMTLLNGRYGEPEAAHESLLRSAEQHATSRATAAAKEAAAAVQRRETLLLRTPTMLHAAEQQRTSQAMRQAEGTLRALHAATLDSLKHSLAASPAEAPSAIDATAAVTINVWLVDDWRLWVYDRIAATLAELHPEERPVNSLRLWMVADLMARSALYTAAADSDEQSAAAAFAGELLGRIPDVDSAEHA